MTLGVDVYPLVLVVDDSVDTRPVLRRLLEASDFRVAEAEEVMKSFLQAW